MYNLYTERRKLSNKSLACDLARQIYVHLLSGDVAVVTDQPKRLLGATRQEWRVLIKQMRTLMMSSKDAEREGRLKQHLSQMKHLKFTVKVPDDLLGAGVIFGTAEDFIRVPPDCPTLYVTYAFDKEKLHMLTSWMPTKGLVVIYD